MQLDPFVLPDDWTPDQAVTVAEFLLALHDAIWDSYGRALPDTRSGPPLTALPVHGQLALPLTHPGDLST